MLAGNITPNACVMTDIHVSMATPQFGPTGHLCLLIDKFSLLKMGGAHAEAGGTFLWQRLKILIEQLVSLVLRFAASLSSGTFHQPNDSLVDFIVAAQPTNDKLDDFIATINSGLQPMFMQIRKGMSEDNGRQYFALVSMSPCDQS